MKITLHTKGIKGSGMMKEGEEPGVLFDVIPQVGDVFIDRVIGAKVHLDHDDVTKVELWFAPSTVDIVPHTIESWAEIAKKLDP